MPSSCRSELTDKPTSVKPVPSRWQELRSLWLLIVISAIAPFMLNGVLPANSAVMAEFNVSYAQVQLTLTVFLLALLLAQSLLGYLADVWGRRPVMLMGLLIFALGCLISAIAPSMIWLLCGRFLQGFGGSVCSFLPRTIVRDRFPKDRAASMIGYMTVAMMVAPLFGPAIGGWVTDALHWRYIYGILMVLALAVTFAAWRSLRETLAKNQLSKPASIVQAGKTLLWMPEFLSYALLMTGSVGVYYSFLASGPYLVMELRDVSASVYGQWFVVVAIGYLLGNAVAAVLSERVGVTRMIQMGIVPLVLGIIGFWLFSSMQSPIGLFGSMACIAFSNGMSIPNLTSGAMSVHAPLAGSASGLAGTLQTAMGIVLSVALGVLLPLSAIWFPVLATLSVALGIGAWFIGQHLAKRLA